MKDTMLFLVRVEFMTELPRIEDAVVQIHDQAVCLITDTTDVEIISSKIILYNYTNRNNGTQS